MSPLEREIARRNARLRAYRDGRGVPVLGGWRWEQDSHHPVWDLSTLLLTLQCGECGCADWRYCPDRENYGIDSATWTPVALEAHLLRQLCSHLAPLLGPDDSDILALLELELLEGAL